VKETVDLQINAVRYLIKIIKLVKISSSEKTGILIAVLTTIALNQA
jgi:hypothetical protein